MSNVGAIEQQIEKLSPAELAVFRRWYAAFDAEAWDRQFAADMKAGQLDALAEKALHSQSSGQSQPFLLITRHQTFEEIKGVGEPSTQRFRT